MEKKKQPFSSGIFNDFSKSIFCPFSKWHWIFHSLLLISLLYNAKGICVTSICARETSSKRSIEQEKNIYQNQNENNRVFHRFLILAQNFNWNWNLARILKRFVENHFEGFWKLVSWNKKWSKISTVELIEEQSIKTDLSARNSPHDSKNAKALTIVDMKSPTFSTISPLPIVHQFPLTSYSYTHIHRRARASSICKYTKW